MILLGSKRPGKYDCQLCSMECQTRLMLNSHIRIIHAEDNVEGKPDILLTAVVNMVQMNLDLRNCDLRKNLDLRKIIPTTRSLKPKLSFSAFIWYINLFTVTLDSGINIGVCQM